MKYELEHARQAGENARAAGRGIDTCPLYAMGEDGRRWQAAWRQGWNARDAEMAKAVKRGR